MYKSVLSGTEQKVVHEKDISAMSSDFRERTSQVVLQVGLYYAVGVP